MSGGEDNEMKENVKNAEMRLVPQTFLNKIP